MRRDGAVTAVNHSVAAQFGADVTSIRAVRRWVADVAEGWKLAEAETLVLLASELATNAVLHARTDYEIRLYLTSDDAVRMEVADQNSRLPSVASVPTDATSGRGLLIVQALASAWGIENQGDGKLVWFELPALRL
jgi:anti-sigma regulatory factor (Ser/Thr protein kinase)